MKHLNFLAVLVFLGSTSGCDDTGATDPTPTESPPRLVVTPSVLDFATVPHNSRVTRTTSLENPSASAVTVDRIKFVGHPGFTASIEGNSYGITPDSASEGIVLLEPLVLTPGHLSRVDISYEASGPEPAEGAITFFTTDQGGSTGGTELRFRANVRSPCITLNPARVSFGGTRVGQTSEILLEVQSCGDVELVVGDIAILDDTTGVFHVQNSRVGTFPVTIPAFSSLFVPVTYTPSATLTIGTDGQVLQDEARLRVSSDAFLAQLDVQLEGHGIDGAGDTCPTAHITVREGDEVTPQTVLHLSGVGSTPATGALTSWEWSVQQPVGSASTFMPSPYVQEPVFEANIIGEYVFRLTVRDSLGTVSCTVAEYTVIVTLVDAIHIELLWRTPGDPNEVDTGGDQTTFSRGSDLNLHFLHPNANGQYFDPLYDCHRDNVNPEWGLPGPVDNPSLDRDDTDGAGPENLNLTVPEQGVRYQVGVHYWDDWGYGDSFATVRVYIYGILRDEWADVKLTANDMWDTHYIDWPSGNVTRIGATPQINQALRP